MLSNFHPTMSGCAAARGCCKAGWNMALFSGNLLSCFPQVSTSKRPKSAATKQQYWGKTRCLFLATANASFQRGALNTRKQSSTTTHVNTSSKQVVQVQYYTLKERDRSAKLRVSRLHRGDTVVIPVWLIGLSIQSQTGSTKTPYQPTTASVLT
jgi:hypothetical protein